LSTFHLLPLNWVESNLTPLMSTSYRLEEKLANMESENKVLRQQALVMSPSNGLGRFKSTVFQVMLGIMGLSKFALSFIFLQDVSRMTSATVVLWSAIS
jgi:hypothetical protein